MRYSTNRPKYRRPTIACMAEVLVADVDDFGDDAQCVRRLELAGFSPLAITLHLEAARKLARDARALEADLWAEVQPVWP